MYLFLALTTCFYLQDSFTQKYIKINHKEPASLVVEPSSATDFVAYQPDDNPNFYFLKAKKHELFLDVLDDSGTVGGNKSMPSKENIISIYLSSYFNYDIKLGDGIIYYDAETNLIKIGPFSEKTHYGFHITPRKTDQYHAEILRERAKEMKDMEDKYKSKENDVTPAPPVTPHESPAETKTPSE